VKYSGTNHSIGPNHFRWVRTTYWSPKPNTGWHRIIFQELAIAWCYIFHVHLLTTWNKLRASHIQNDHFFTGAVGLEIVSVNYLTNVTLQHKTSVKSGKILAWFAYFQGVICIWKIFPLSWLYHLLCRSHFCHCCIRLDLRFQTMKVITDHFQDFRVWMVPNLHQVAQNMQIRQHSEFTIWSTFQGQRSMFKMSPLVGLFHYYLT
jgi:hypothetical protein